MKSLEELENIKNEALKEMRLRNSKHSTKVVVAMGDCGIKSGGKKILDFFVKELRTRDVQNAVAMTSDCIGMCECEPVVKIIADDGSKVIYANMTEEKAKRVIEEHIIGGKVCQDLLIK